MSAYYYGTPPWVFRDPPRRRRRREEYDCPDPYEQIERHEKWMEYWKKRVKEEGKKPPSSGEQLMMFLTQLSVMIVIGLPLGLLFLKMMESLYKLN